MLGEVGVGGGGWGWLFGGMVKLLRVKVFMHVNNYLSLEEELTHLPSSLAWYFRRFLTTLTILTTFTTLITLTTTISTFTTTMTLIRREDLEMNTRL